MKKWRLLFGLIPIRITYTDEIPEGVGGFFRGWFLFWQIKIKLKYKDDEGICQHEMEHFKQHLLTLNCIPTFGLVTPFLYRFVGSYRLWAEVQAYKRQLQYEPAKLDVERYKKLYAKALSTKYKLDISEKEIINLL